MTTKPAARIMPLFSEILLFNVTMLQQCSMVTFYTQTALTMTSPEFHFGVLEGSFLPLSIIDNDLSVITLLGLGGVIFAPFKIRYLQKVP